MTTDSSGPGALAVKIQTALTGVQNVLATGSAFQIGGVTMKQSQIAAQLSGYLPTFTAVTTDKAQYQQSVAARTTLEPEAREFLVNLRAALVAFYKRGNPALSQFGFGTGAPGVQSPETLVVAAATRNLTRAKRGTLGKQQKQAITLVSQPAVTVGSQDAVVLPTVSSTPPAVEAALAAAQAAAMQQAAAQSGGGSQVAPAPAAQPAAPVTAPVAPAPVTVATK